MKIRFVKSLAVVIAMVAGSSAFGQDYFEGCESDIETVSYLGGDSCQKDGDDCGKGGKGGCGVLDGLGCCGGGGVYFDAELLFFKPDLGISDGGNLAGPFVPTFNYEAAPRIAVGYVGPAGLGVRFRYFDFSHDSGAITAAGLPGTPGAASVLVDTYTMDAEFFEELEVGCATTVEWSAGIRYLDFKRRNVAAIGGPDIRGNQRQFSGWGLNFGLKAERCLGPGRIYGRARWAVMEDENSTVSNIVGTANNPMINNVETIYDDKVMQTEIALGYEVSRCTSFGVLTGRIAYEIQYWEGLGNVVGNSPNAPASTQKLTLDGFDGLVLGLELAR